MLNIKYKTNINDGWINIKSFNEISNNAIVIYCSNNELTSLPELKHLTNLQYIHCHHNQLTSLPDLQHLTNFRLICIFICNFLK